MTKLVYPRIKTGLSIGKPRFQQLGEIIKAALKTNDGHTALIAAEELVKFLRPWARRNRPKVEKV
jgi:hypothetical protein